MEKNVLKIAFAAFLHDIGRIATSVHAMNVQGSSEKIGFWTRQTDAFIRYARANKLLPDIFTDGNPDDPDDLLSLATRSAAPETPLQSLINVASGISLGSMAINEAEENGPSRFRRLHPLLANLGNKESTPSGWRFTHHTVTAANTMPVENSGAGALKDVETARHANSEAFLASMNQLCHREEAAALWFEHFENLVMIHGAQIPARTDASNPPDISLFDHLKTSSALATALFLYHEGTNTLTTDAVRDLDSKKFLTISGDFYGIQSFIFSEHGETSKHRSKMLRGRSFAVSLITELAADMLCREIGIPSICILTSAAGKFTIIAPNTDATTSAIGRTSQDINSWLMDISFGENALGIGYVEASASDFLDGRLKDLNDRLAETMEEKKYRRIDLKSAGERIGFLSRFNTDLRHALCPFCGKRPSSPAVEKSPLLGETQSACLICRDHIFLGKNLVRKERLAIVTKDAPLHGGDNKLHVPIFGHYQAVFVQGKMNDLARQGKLLKYWDIRVGPDGELARDVSVRLINGYVPIYPDDTGSNNDREPGNPKLFDDIAAASLTPDPERNGARGTEALGIFIADVDDLGLLMARGLPGKRLCLSRMMTASRQLHWYFALHLPWLIQRDVQFHDVYTVFAGGDDLFLIGPWNRITELAGEIHKTFSEYACRNPDIHISGGIALRKPHTPVEHLAQDAEDALSKSKTGGKNQITLFGQTATWSAFFQLKDIGEKLAEWHGSKLINNAMLFRLNDFADLAERECQVLDKKEASLADMQCLKWPAFLYYTSARNAGKPLEKSERDAFIDTFTETVMAWLQDHAGRLKIALWDIIYNNRRG